MGRPNATRRKWVHITMEDAGDSLLIDGPPALLRDFLDLIGARERGRPDSDGESAHDGPLITLQGTAGD